MPYMKPFAMCVICNIRGYRCLIRLLSGGKLDAARDRRVAEDIRGGIHFSKFLASSFWTALSGIEGTSLFQAITVAQSENEYMRRELTEIGVKHSECAVVSRRGVVYCVLVPRYTKECGRSLLRNRQHTSTSKERTTKLLMD